MKPLKNSYIGDPALERGRIAEMITNCFARYTGTLNGKDLTATTACYWGISREFPPDFKEFAKFIDSHAVDAPFD
jgi:hypothetical protein